jgi:hypothetical protein
VPGTELASLIEADVELVDDGYITDAHRIEGKERYEPDTARAQDDSLLADRDPGLSGGIKGHGNRLDQRTFETRDVVRQLEAQLSGMSQVVAKGAVVGRR